MTPTDAQLTSLPPYHPPQVTQLERHMNLLVIALFATLIFFACMMAAGDQIWMNTHPGYWYLEFTNTWPDLGIASDGGSWSLSDGGSRSLSDGGLGA